MGRGTKRRQTTLLFIMAMLITFCLGVGLSYAYFSDSKTASNTLSFGKLKIATNASNVVNLTLTGNASDESGKLAPNDTITIKGLISLEENSVPAYIRMKMDIYENGTTNKIGATFKSALMEEMAKITSSNMQWFVVGNYLYLGNQITASDTFTYDNTITLTETMIPEEMQGKDVNVVMEYQAIQSAGMGLTLTGYTEANATKISALKAWDMFLTAEEQAQITLEEQSVSKLTFTVEEENKTAEVDGYVSGQTLGDIAIPKYIKKNTDGTTYARADESENGNDGVYNVTSIGNFAFSGCDALATINFGGTKEQWNGIDKSDAKIPTGDTVKCTDGEITIS